MKNKTKSTKKKVRKMVRRELPKHSIYESDECYSSYNNHRRKSPLRQSI